jgi:hypothetical protein
MVGDSHGLFKGGVGILPILCLLPYWGNDTVLLLVCFLAIITSLYLLSMTPILTPHHSSISFCAKF